MPIQVVADIRLAGEDGGFRNGVLWKSKILKYESKGRISSSIIVSLSENYH